MAETTCDPIGPETCYEEFEQYIWHVTRNTMFGVILYIVCTGAVANVTQLHVMCTALQISTYLSGLR